MSKYIYIYIYMNVCCEYIHIYINIEIVCCEYINKMVLLIKPC